jgi:hypothetical protein
MMTASKINAVGATVYVVAKLPSQPPIALNTVVPSLIVALTDLILAEADTLLLALF